MNDCYKNQKKLASNDCKEFFLKKNFLVPKMAVKWPKMHEIIRFFDKKCILVRVFRKQIQNLVEIKKMVRCHSFFNENPFRGGKIPHKSRF